MHEIFLMLCLPAMGAVDTHRMCESVAHEQTVHTAELFPVFNHRLAVALRGQGDPFPSSMKPLVGIVLIGREFDAGRTIFWWGMTISQLKNVTPVLRTQVRR